MPSIDYDITSYDDIADMDKAKEVAEVLFRNWPNHLWAVGWQGRVLVIKLPVLLGDLAWVIPHGRSYSASDLAHQAMLGGGSMLERAGVSRSRSASTLASG